MNKAGVVAVLALSLAHGGVASALTQPNGDPIPTQPGCNSNQPTGLAAELACVCVQPNTCNIGAVCASENNCADGKNGDCETTMWHSFNDNTCIPSNLSGLDPHAEAAVEPQAFHPTCPQTFRVVSRGTALFKDAFGWYNVTGAKPETADMHIMLDCSTAPGTEVVLDLQSEPGYLGGDIGFFIVTPESHASPGSCADGDCCASLERSDKGVGHIFFSERKLNPDFVGADSLIHLIIYQSHLEDSTFYFAWEDIYGGSNNDFTDLLTGVSGIHCAGGGKSCDTGGKGVCGRGVTLCKQGVLGCEQVFQPTTEICNAIDDDCNGIADDEAVCPEPHDICHQGRCVPACGRGEFACLPKTVCDGDSALCLDPACIGVSCPEEQVCRGGKCVPPCSDVVCPHGQECFADKCFDLCEGVSCPAGEACVQGKCVNGCAQCGGITCAPPLICNKSAGNCYDPSCSPECPKGSYCEAGKCKDACDGAKCPGGEPCINGKCGGSDEGGGGSGSTGSGKGGASQNADDDDGESGMPACTCRFVGPHRGGAAAAFLLLLTLGALRTRRRRRRLSA